MAYNNPGNAGGDYYADAAPAGGDEMPAAEADTKEESGGEPTAEIPKALLGGKTFKPGEEVMLEIVQVMEDSVLVKYASEKGGSEGGGESYVGSAEEGGGNPGGMY